MALEHDRPPPSALRGVLSRILALNRAEPSVVQAPADAEPVSPSPESRLGALAGALQSTWLAEAAVQSPVPERFGRYVILDKLGEGGLSVVYSAYDPELDRKVAIKLVRTGGTDGERHTRLLREAQAIARLSHPNVIQVFDAGESEGQVFVAMELIHGQTLRAWLRQEQHDYWARSPEQRDAAGNARLVRRSKSFELARARPWQETLAIFLEAGRGLAAAHVAGVIHRDFKPDNVMIDRDRRVRVLDFGLARSVRQGALPDAATAGIPAGASPALSTTLTQAGEILGTPAYMSPEQLDGQTADARTDQFSFCVALYEAVYGKRPFGGQTCEALMMSIEAGADTPPGDAAAPAQLWPMLQRGLAKAPLARYPSMDELLVELESLIRVRSRRWWWWGAASLAAVGLLGWIVFHERSTERVCELDASAVASASEGVPELQARAHAWRAAQASACAQSELDLGVARCLERQLVELETLSGATDATAERVGEVMAALPPPEACRASFEPASAVLQPVQPVMHETVRRRIELALGAPQDGLGHAVRTLVTELEDSTDDVELAEMLLVIASLGDRGGRSPEEALYEAVERSEAAGRPDIAARAWLGLVDRRMASERAAAQELLRVALTALVRAGHPRWLMARWHEADARLAIAAGPSGRERAVQALEAQLAALETLELRDPKRERAVIEQLVLLLHEANRTGEAERWRERLTEADRESAP